MKKHKKHKNIRIRSEIKMCNFPLKMCNRTKMCNPHIRQIIYVQKKLFKQIKICLITKWI